MTFDDIITGILLREGAKYTNIVGDAGGPTKFGITQATLSQWRKHPVGWAEVANLTEAEARKIYMTDYIIAPGYSKIHYAGLVEELIDAGVNHGVTTAIKILQRGLSLHDDGVIGTATVATVNGMPEAKAVLLFLGSRAKYYGGCSSAPHNWKFASGWFNRLGEMITKYGQEL